MNALNRQPAELLIIDNDPITLMGTAAVLDMAGYICPHCGEGSDPFGSGGAEAAAAELGVEFLGRLPLSPAVRSASDSGNPPAAGEGPEAAAFAELADKVIGALETVRS